MADMQPISDPRVSIVVPVFNSEESLGELSERIASTLERAPVSVWELILVNDGSVDSSWDQVVKLSREHAAIGGLDLTRNWGQHNALLAGLHAARYEVVVTLDDDLQNPPEEIPRLIEALRPELDVVYGTPFVPAQPTYRRIGSATVRTTIRTLTQRDSVSVSTGFRALRGELGDQLPETSGRRVAFDSLLRTLTDRFGSIPVEHRPRRVGRSTYTLGKLARLAVTEVATDLRRRGGRPALSYGIKAATEPALGDDGGT